VYVALSNNDELSNETEVLLIVSVFAVPSIAVACSELVELVVPIVAVDAEITVESTVDEVCDDTIDGELDVESDALVSVLDISFDERGDVILSVAALSSLVLVVSTDSTDVATELVKLLLSVAPDISSEETIVAAAFDTEAPVAVDCDDESVEDPLETDRILLSSEKVFSSPDVEDVVDEMISDESKDSVVCEVVSDIASDVTTCPSSTETELSSD
jgi:hypothetical protein